MLDYRLRSKNAFIVVIAIVMLLGNGNVQAESKPTATLKSKIKKVNKISSRIESVPFESEVLGTKKTFCVVLPPDLAKCEKEVEGRPFLLLLHGSGRNERTLIDNPVTRKALLDAGFTVVLPDGDSAWYVDSPVNPKAKYATYIEEVLRLAEERYRLSRDPRRRAIAGWSMGGYGCVRFAETHPNEFGTVASMIGVIDYPRAPEQFPPGQSYRLRKDCFGDDPKVWEKHNPIRFAEKLRGMSILLVTGEVAFDRMMNENFCKELDRLKIPYLFQIIQGGHTPAVVEKLLPLVLEHVRAGLGLEKNK